MRNWKLQLFLAGCLCAIACSQASAATNLPFGATLQGAITSPAQTAAYAFTASAGDVVLLTMATSTGAPRITLVNPDGSQNSVVSPNGCDYNGVTTVEMGGGMNGVKLAKTGTYTVVVGACNSEDTFTYSIYLQRTNNPGTAIGSQWGQTLSGQISSMAQSNTYTFTASASDSVLFTMGTSDFAPKITLFNPDGSQADVVSPNGCDYNSVTSVEMSGGMNSVKLKQTGTYTVLVGACNDLDKGSYGLYAQRTNDPGDASELLWGQTQDGTIATAAQSVAYVFTGGSGDAIDLTMSTSDFAPKITLFNPDGSQVNVVSPNGCDYNGVTTISMNSVKLTEAGTYTVLAGACNDEDTGKYSISSQCFVGACPLPAPTLTSMSPTSAKAGGQSFVLTVNGSNFVSISAGAAVNTLVRWNGVDLPNTPEYISSSQLKVTVSAAEIASVGQIPVTVYTPPPGGGASPPAPLIFTVTGPPAATPTFSPAGGSYALPQSVSIADATSGATIYYTTDLSNPATSATRIKYAAPIAVSTSATIMAIAISPSYENSAVATAVYKLPAATPVIMPGTGTYATSQTVTITDATNGATIYYSTDGTDPATSTSRIQYTVPFLVSSTETIKAVAAANEYYLQSAEASAGITIESPTAPPMFSPAVGTYNSVETVSITDSSPSAAIYYTTNGTTPTNASTLYSGPITITASTTFKAIAVSPGQTLSPVAPAVYRLIGSPTCISAPATSVGTSLATLNAEVNTLGLTGSYLFQYGTGLSSLTENTPSTNLSAYSTALPASYKIPGLSSNATYYFRVVVTTAGGTCSGAVLSFTTN